MTFTPVRLLPDAEAVARDILLASGVSVGVNVTDEALASLPYVACRRFGGASVHPEKMDRATFAVDVFSKTRPTAVELAETCRSLLWQAKKTQAKHLNATVSSFVEIVAPSEIRDGNQPSEVYRFTASYSLHVRPSR